VPMRCRMRGLAGQLSPLGQGLGPDSRPSTVFPFSDFHFLFKFPEK
jgi:hypothetical protein